MQTQKIFTELFMNGMFLVVCDIFLSIFQIRVYCCLNGRCLDVEDGHTLHLVVRQPQPQSIASSVRLDDVPSHPGLTFS